METQTNISASRGFTLIEILGVVVILAIIAVLVIPTFAEANYNSRQTVFATDIKIFADAAWFYTMKTGEYLPTTASGVCPAGLETYIDSKKYTRPTTIGGLWDCETDTFGIKSGIGVDFGSTGDNPGDTYMLGIDALFDDGNLSTGQFRKISDDRYFIVLRDI